MRNKSKSWLNTFQAACRARFDLQMEAIALRHRVMVLQRSGKRPEFSPLDRLLWMIPSTFGPTGKTSAPKISASFGKFGVVYYQEICFS